MQKDDPTGRKQLSRNVLTSWLSHLIFVVFGFVMPRMVDETLGQHALGVWDFGWAVVSYLGLAMVGIGSSVNRYVANYQASGEMEELSRTMSSVVVLQFLIAAVVCISTIYLSHILPTKMHDKLGESSHVAGQVVLFLGLSLAVQMAFDSCRGVLTGVHRWSAHNALNAGSYAISSVIMIAALLSGRGLQGMAVAYFAVTVATELVRWYLARRACPAIVYRVSSANLADARKVFSFGIKNVALYLPRLIVRQSVNVFVVMHLGPAMLAILARPQSLMSHVETLINKFSFVLTPTAGSLQGGGHTDELRDFAIQSMRTSWIFAILPSVYLFVLGDKVVDLWMGDGYGRWGLMAILSSGAILPMAASATLTILAGLNQHGRVVKHSLIWTGLPLALVIPIGYKFGWTLEFAAFLTVIPMNVGVGAVAIVVGCFILGISAKEYLSKVVAKPLLTGLICAVALTAVRLAMPNSTVGVLALGAALEGVIVFWMFGPEIKRIWSALR